MKVAFVFGDDWNAIYVDGILFYEGHDSTPPHIIDLFKYRFENIEMVELAADENWLIEEGGYPTNLEDCKFS